MKRTIAVDANPLTRQAQTGTEIYARELALRLPLAAPEFEWRFYASRPAAGPAPDLTVLPMRRLWSQVRLPAALRSMRPDLFFAPSHVVPFLTPGLALTTVHDLAFERVPKAYGRRQRAYLQLTTRWALRRCPVVLAVSEATRRDLVELYGADPARVRVVYPGLAAPGPQARLGALPARYVLHVGRVEAKKNQLAALAAVERIPGLQLVCAGAVSDPALADRLRSGGRALVLGPVSDAEREALYAGAEALVFPSLYEGFGLPVLEAMARGLPVVTVRASSLPETAGDAALYADGPDDVDGLAAALEGLLGDSSLRARLVRAGRARAAEFTWERTAGGVLGVIRELLA